MEARLTVAGSESRREAGSDSRSAGSSTTERRWEVEGTEGGSDALHLTLSALITVEVRERLVQSVCSIEKSNRSEPASKDDGIRWGQLAVVVGHYRPASWSGGRLREGTSKRRDEEVETGYVQGPRSETWHWCGDSSNDLITVAGHGPPVRVAASANNAARRTTKKTAVREPFQASACFQLGRPDVALLRAIGADQYVPPRLPVAARVLECPGGTMGGVPAGCTCAAGGPA